MLGGSGCPHFSGCRPLLESKYVVGLNTVNFRDYFVELYQLLIVDGGVGLPVVGFGNTMSVQIGVAP